MDRIKRIKEMEMCLDTSRKAIDRLGAAFEKYLKARASIEKLAEYYDGPQWRSDFEYDESGGLPADLKRGVLSEDAVYNLLEDDRALKENIINELKLPNCHHES